MLLLLYREPTVAIVSGTAVSGISCCKRNGIDVPWLARCLPEKNKIPFCRSA